MPTLLQRNDAGHGREGVHVFSLAFQSFPGRPPKFLKLLRDTMDGLHGQIPNVIFERWFSDKAERRWEEFSEFLSEPQLWEEHWHKVRARGDLGASTGSAILWTHPAARRRAGWTR